MKRIVTLALAATMASGVYAQSNVVKIKPIRIATTAISSFSPTRLDIAYERKILPVLSAQVNVGFGLKKSLAAPGFLSDGNEDVFSSIGFSGLETKSFGISPEVRWYPAAGAPKGFFLAGYFSFNRFTATSPFDFEAELDVDVAGQTIPINYPFNLDFEGSVTALNYGLAIGNQWLVANDMISIEVVWFGLGWGSANISGTIAGTLVDNATLRQEISNELGFPYTGDLPVDQVTWSDVEQEYGDDIESETSDLPLIDPISVTSSASSLTIETSVPLPSIRLMNFSVGFAF